MRNRCTSRSAPSRNAAPSCRAPAPPARPAARALEFLLRRPRPDSRRVGAARATARRPRPRPMRRGCVRFGPLRGRCTSRHRHVADPAPEPRRRAHDGDAIETWKHGRGAASAPSISCADSSRDLYNAGAPLLMTLADRCVAKSAQYRGASPLQCGSAMFGRDQTTRRCRPEEPAGAALVTSHGARGGPSRSPQRVLRGWSPSARWSKVACGSCACLGAAGCPKCTKPSTRGRDAPSPSN